MKAKVTKASTVGDISRILFLLLYIIDAREPDEFVELIFRLISSRHFSYLPTLLPCISRHARAQKHEMDRRVRLAVFAYFVGEYISICSRR